MSAEAQPKSSLVKASDCGLGATDFIVKYGLIWGNEDIGREVWLSQNVARALVDANERLGRISAQMMERFGSFTEPLGLVAMAGVRTANQQATLTRLSKAPHINKEVGLFYDINEKDQARQQMWANVRIADCVREDWHIRPNVVDIGIVGVESGLWMDTSLCYSATNNLLLRTDPEKSRNVAAGYLAAWVLQEHGFRHNKHKNHWHWKLENYLEEK